MNEIIKFVAPTVYCDLILCDVHLRFLARRCQIKDEGIHYEELKRRLEYVFRSPNVTALIRNSDSNRDWFVGDVAEKVFVVQDNIPTAITEDQSSIETPLSRQPLQTLKRKRVSWRPSCSLTSRRFCRTFDTFPLPCLKR